MTSETDKNRKTGRCLYARRCGGCDMIDVPMEEQLEAKQRFVEECIGDFGRVDTIIRMKNPERYRNKVTAIFGLDRNRRPACGVYRRGTHELIPVKNCRIENKRADAVIQTIFSMLGRYKLKVYDEDTGYGLIRAVQVRTAHATGQMMVTIVTADPAFPKAVWFVRDLLQRHPEITTIVQNINTRSTSMILGAREKILYGDGYIEDVLCGKRFRLSSRSFYQVNSVQTEKLYNIAVDCAGLTGKERVLDAYCGIGTIGICAADRCKTVLSVELNGDAVRDAVQNARLNGADNVEVCEDDAGRFMEELAAQKEKVDLLFMDPPRSGASEAFLAAACQLAPAKIVYISCNPVTLGENLAFLTQRGYRMKKAAPVDMFPYTQLQNVETVTLLVRSDGVY